ncbi:hypothetical protein RclHR1_17930003 [Rhizophagus clarus]|uniref:Uncharacterized protein n=2 Tax=Rhizophagus clarus TaxID=94130 RepID=A0A2Z6QMN2_9GLOM|nr:hypothetical protein RclHR1_17930003 [Rhizophagus clarus]
MLKGNQFAALPGNFTFEPIRMINEIIQDVKENNKELWLLSQDLGKAYNRINIFMLEKWLAPSQNNLEKILKIADSFYKLNDIQVNKEKSELLVRYKQGRYRLKLKSHEPVTLKFGSNSIFIIPVFLRSSIRILGVHFDERNTFQSIIKRINDEINELQHKYTRKKITDKYMIYIFNSVIIPKIECWSQVKVLTKKFMDKVMNQFLSTFKKKLRLSITTPNEIFFNKIYNIKNISDNQDQAKITNILIQINDASVLEQILSDDGLLLSINEIRDKFNIPNILALKWYRKVIMALNTNKDILSSINRIYNTNHINCPITTQQFSRESEADRIRKNYTSKPILLNTDNYPNYYVGTPKKYVDFDTNFFTLEHYNVESVNSNNKLEISHCQGCNNTTSTYIPLRPRRDQLQESFCNIECNIFNTSILYMGQCTTVTRDKHHLISVDLNSHLHQAINSTLFTISPQTNRNTRINITCKSYNIDKQLLQYFEFNSKLKALYTIQQHLKKEDTLSFYTDGSLINANTQAASMTASFIHVSDTNNITHLFTTTIENWPSSFRAELFTILLLLIVSPYGCRVDINTDSQNSINIIQHIYNNPTFSVRDYFRLPNNNIVINNIISIIKAKNLTLRFNKVKAHNNDYFNKRIDQECKIAHYDSTPAFVIKQQYFDNIQFIPQWGSILIERKLRNDKSETNFEQHRKIIFKYKLLLEQLAVLEKTKRQYYDIYQDSDCPLCAEEKETFIHVCDQFDLLLFTKSFHSVNITFLDIIEGFVPTTLVEWLQKYTTATQHRNLLIKAFDKLCEDSLELWKSRCEAFASIEHMCGITQYMKRSILYNTKYKESFTSYYNINSFFDFSSFNIEYIEYINLLIRFNLQKAAKEQNEFLKSDFILKISDYNLEQLIFIDEIAKDKRSISRAYGYSTINTRTIKSVIFIRGKRYIILLALTLDGIITAKIIEGSCNKENFQVFIINQVVNVIIMDNAVIHHDEALVELIEETGDKVVYLPPYSPDFNPIETVFSTLKIWFKRYRDFIKICDDIEYLILYVLSQITSDMARNYFAGSIYI